MRIRITLAIIGLVAATTFADWPGAEVKWDQLTPGIDNYGAHSTIDTDTPLTSITADDFLCTQTGPIAEVRFAGFSQFGNLYIDQFRLTFWNDVPAGPDDESHPDALLYEYYADAADPLDPNRIGYQDLGDGTFLVNLPADLWFWQQQGSVYWIGIQGLMVEDGFADAFYWNFAGRYIPTWGDDAAFASDYFGFPPWANWGWPIRDPLDPGFAGPDLYEGPFPAGWESSADMAFALYTPEPVTLVLLAIGGLALIRRR